MNLLFVHECHGSLGGAEANVFITAAEMQRRGHRVGLLTQRGTGTNEAAWRELFAGDLFLPPDLEAALGRFAPDLLYVHKWDELPSLRRLRAAGPPLVRMGHDHDVYCLRSYRYNVFTRRICHRAAGPYCVFPCLAPIRRARGGRFPLRWASYFDKLEEIRLNRAFDRHLVVTRYMAAELVRNGFDPERIEIFPPVPRPAPPLNSTFSDRNLLLYAGQLIRGKGVDVLLRALARMTERFEAVILGDGRQRAACERLARRLGLGGRVRFAGFVSQAELAGYYREATAVMIPSVWPEPIATIGLEVMRCGLPVVAFDVGGISDWLRDGVNGHLVPWMDTATFAARLDGLLRDKARARAMGEAGREIAARDYDFDRHFDRLEALFTRTAAAAAPAA